MGVHNDSEVRGKHLGLYSYELKEKRTSGEIEFCDSDASYDAVHGGESTKRGRTSMLRPCLIRENEGYGEDYGGKKPGSSEQCAVRSPLVYTRVQQDTIQDLMVSVAP
jgi:hypothetical protein